MTGEHHRALRRGLEFDQRRRRALLSLGQRLDTALRASLRLSEAPAGTLEGFVTRGKAQSSAPPDASGLYGSTQQGSIHDIFHRRHRLMIEALEREVDNQLTRPAIDAKETREEKDARLIKDFEGDPPHLVSFMDPTLGSPRSVERARVRMKRRTIDGGKIEEE